MTARSSLDRDSFERLLSNAFAVQESGMDAKSLTAIVELQQAIATGQADLDRTMEVIAGHALNVANATGIAIGLLEGDQLVYRAGSGNGASYVGQHVMATLCVSAHNAASGEILRVENAHTDRRIEAAICRQFGATSLLILPICDEGTMAGVLNVLFDEAHVFEHREALTYRLMANLVGEAMSYARRPEQKKAAVDLSPMRQSMLTRPQRDKSRNDSAPVPPATTKGATYPAHETVIAWASTLTTFTRRVWPVSDRAKRLPWFKGRWEAAVGLAALILIACWVGFGGRHPASTSGNSGLQGSNSLEQQMAVAPAKGVLATGAAKPQPAVVLEPEKGKTSTSRPTRVSDRNIRVLDVSDDVTVRYFTSTPPPKQVLQKHVRVLYVSDDVTVRYFTPKLPVSPLSHPAETAAQPAKR